MARFSFPAPAVIAVLIFVSSALSLPASAADDGDVVRLKERIFELEERVRSLESQLKECKSYPVRENSPSEGWRNKKNWRMLEIGMEQGEVEELLGEPLKIIQGFRTLWYYPNLYRGYVSFDEEGSVTGWSEP